jgi:raffinose/stachyose/melibiose transport system substrate-binding protein
MATSKWIASTAVLVALALTAGACGGDDSSNTGGGEITITCASCQESPTDPFLQFNYEAVQQFNATYKGRYRVKVVQNQHASSGPDRLQYYQRLALANDLPDVFLVNRGELESLQKTGKLMDFAPGLAKDATWKGSFYDGAFTALSQGGHTWAIPQQRDAIGIYYNKAVLQQAGIGTFPATWDELRADCAKVKAKGKICLAMDGDWVTLLMWANLIGTQPGGKDFLFSGIRQEGYADNPAVVRATELLKRLHTEGFVNRDAFSGDYNNAATPFIRGDAAMVANGPWMVSTDIKGKNASKDLYPEVGYAAAPGWTADERGLIVVAGNGGWVSGTRDARKQQAVTAFMKFITSRRLSIEQTKKTGAYPAVQLKLTAKETGELEPLAASLVKQSTSIPDTYAHVYFSAPADFGAAWKNVWPAYVQGKMSTKEFLDRLAAESGS